MSRRRQGSRRTAGLILLLIAVTWSAPAAAQPSSAGPQVETPPRVVDVTFRGDRIYPTQQLLLRVRTRANRRLLGIPGLNWWMWLYRAGESEAVGGAIGDALMSVGEAPAYLDMSLVTADAERLRLLYQQEGYRSARVEAEVDTLDEGRHARVIFHLDAGPATYVRGVSFAGADSLSVDQRFALARNSLLRTRGAEWIDSTRFRAAGRRFSEPVLLDERRRILSFLRNEGYATITRDSIRAIVFPEREDSFDVTFQIDLGRRYRFGDISVAIAGPEAESHARTDTLVVAGERGGGGEVRVAIQGDQRLRPSLVYRSMQFQPGEWYDQSKLLATKRRLEASGVFVFTDVVGQMRQVEPAPDGAPRLPHQIDMRTRRRHQVRLETFMLQRSGILAAENEIGAGAGIAYENANLFGGGEAFRIGLSGSVAADVDSTFFTSAQTEVSTSLTLPYFVRPFRWLDPRLNLLDARTRFAFNLLAARRDNLNLVIRGRGTALVRLEAQHSPTISSWVDLIDLSISNPDTLTGFRATFLDRVIGEGRPVLDPVQQAQILEDYTQPQINNAFRYTLRSARVNPLTRERGYAYEMIGEVGGNLPYVLDRIVFTPGSLEGSIPGLPFFGGDRESRLVYRRYARLVADLRRYRPLGGGAVLAGKFVGGVSHPLGASRVVPFDRRFYAGGGSSVRGWGLRLLGPGSARFGTAETGDELTNILGGDIKLEGSIELRQTLIRNLLAADWLSTLFVDGGNVWFGPENPGFGAGVASGRFRIPGFVSEIGIGSGAGLRIAWDYLIIRLDLAYKVHDPTRPGLLPEGLRAPVVHFGIGHTF